MRVVGARGFDADASRRAEAAYDHRRIAFLRRPGALPCRRQPPEEVSILGHEHAPPAVWSVGRSDHVRFAVDRAEDLVFVVRPTIGAEAGVDEFPLNILNPRAGTPLERSEVLDPLTVVRTIAVYRLIMPRVILKVSGGREVSLGPYQEFAFKAGADSLILGDYLTTKGGKPAEDIEMVKRLGFEIAVK